MKPKQIISLGFFCGIAEESERLGIRNKSYPFDWLITPWESIEKLISTKFKDFLNFEYLSQQQENHHIYINTKLNCKFYHDFNPYDSLEKQLVSVQNKYQKRINNFFEDIQSPTIFIRYIANKDELNYIESNYTYLLNILQKYNSENEIIFIANNNLFSNTINILSVSPDQNDVVSRTPLRELKDLEIYLINSVDEDKRKENLIFTNKKLQEKNRIIYKIINKKRKIFNNIYTHTKTHSAETEMKIP